ncbi:MFS transporter [Nocardia goodfellowii]
MLAIRNFRLFVAGQVTSVTGTWMMVAAQDWLVLELTDDSAMALALLTVCQFAPAVLLPVGAGLLADRIAKRTLLVIANLAAALVASIQAVVVLSGRVELWQLYLVALAIGIVMSIETPIRMSFISEIVGDERFRDASALSAMYFSVAQLCGPAAAGLLIGLFGTGTAMAVNAVSYSATVLGLVLMRPGDLVSAAPRAAALDVLRGWRRIRNSDSLMWATVLLAGVGFFALNLRVTAPLLAKSAFEVNPAAFGLVTAALAAGSLLAALLVGGRGRPSLHAALGYAALLGGAEAALGLATYLPVAMLLLVLCGAAMTAFLQATNHHLQLGSGPAYRTHVIAVYTTIVQGVTPLAALAVGFFAHRVGVRPVVSLGGLAAVCVAAAIFFTCGRRKEPTGAPVPPGEKPTVGP